MREKTEGWARSGLEVAMCAADLTLDLFAGPACGLNGSGGELAILTCVLDHLGEPILAIEVLEFAVGECICKITVDVNLSRRKRCLRTYPMTPIEERMRESLRFGSWKTVFNSEKIDSTYG
jgi:hypothetical protein